MITVSEYTCRTLLLYITSLSVCLLNVPQSIRDVVRTQESEVPSGNSGKQGLGRDIGISFGRHITTAPQAEKNM